MLRKVSHIILTLLLLVSTMGVAVSKHYCSGSFVSVSVFNEAESCCGESDCCHNENEVFQVKTDFSAPIISSVPILAELDILGHNLFTEILFTSFFTEKEEFLFDSSPPPKTIQKSLSLKQVYLL